MATAEEPLAPGTTLAGFTVRDVRALPDLRAQAYWVEHSGSGARLLHIATADSENLFSITLPTAPWDDAGEAHILEHSVLGGSRRYPVRQPFFEMVKMSMGTFINAMTSVEWTGYPVASTVPQDLFNLADVYFDAVFHPLLTEETFLREGHRLTPADANDPTGPLVETGVVYNEMKGYYSRPEGRLYRSARQHLLPDTIYAWDSGGDPAAIPDLTYEHFRRFHETYYHPASALFLTYGDIPLREHLTFLAERLADFQRVPPAPLVIPRQPRWSAPRRVELTYQVGEDEDTQAHTYLLMQWVAGTASDPAESMAFEVLDWILDGNEAAPLRKALVDSHLGQAVTHTGADSWGHDQGYQVGLKGSEPERAQAFERLVLDTLRGIADQELAAERVEAAFHQAAYSQLEVTGQFPLRVLFRAIGPWRVGADPLAFVSMRRHLDDLHAAWRADPLLFNRLIRERLVDNPHRLLTVFRPSRDYQSRLDHAFRERMAAVRAKLTDDEARRIAVRSAEVEQDAGTRNSPQEVALLPQLRLADVPRRPRHIPTTVTTVAPHTVLLRNDVFSAGVNYLHLDLAAEALPDDLWRQVPRYVDAIHQLGAAGMNYERVAERVAAASGGIHCWPHIGFAVDGTPQRRIRFSLKALDDQIADALAILGDLVFAVDAHDRARLEVVLAQALANVRTGLVNGGREVARRHAARLLNSQTALIEEMYGKAQFHRLERLRADADATLTLVADIDRIRDALRCGPLTASFTGSDHAAQAVAETLQAWAQRRQGQPAHAVPPPQPSGQRRVGLAAPLQVAYCAQVLPAPRIDSPDAPLLSVASQILTSDYLLPEIRFKGTAYGGGLSYNAMGGEMTLLSWQDPHVARTLDVFQRVPEFVRAADWSRTPVERAIIATLKDGERPLRPGEATGTALDRHVAGISPEMRDARHRAILEAPPESVRDALLRVWEAGHGLSTVTVVAGRGKLEEDNRALGQWALAIEDLLGEDRPKP